MPTVSGFLLGYPVVYLVDAGNVDAAAQHLSSVRLALHTLVASCPLLKVRCKGRATHVSNVLVLGSFQTKNMCAPQEAIAQEGGGAAANLETLDALCSFTVPAHLLGRDVEQCPQRQLLGSMWPGEVADMQARGPAWTAPVLRVTETQQAVRL